MLLSLLEIFKCFKGTDAAAEVPFVRVSGEELSKASPTARQTPNRATSSKCARAMTYVVKV